MWTFVDFDAQDTLQVHLFLLRLECDSDLCQVILYKWTIYKKRLSSWTDVIFDGSYE